MCFRCLAKKPSWTNAGLCAQSPRRNLCYQLAANHRDPRALLAEACEAAGKPIEAATWRAAAPFKCPHCAVVVDGTLEAKEAKEWAEATESQRIIITRVHSKTHAGAMRGLRPVLPVDNRSRASSALHRRMNACGNNLVATFLKVPFNLKMRQQANALLAKCKLLWRFPEKKKKRASIPLGNDSRKFHSNKQLLVGLFEIFYPDELQEVQEQLAALGKAAAQAANVRGDATAPAPAPAPAPTPAPPKAPAKRKEPMGAAVVMDDGIALTASDVQSYAKARVGLARTEQACAATATSSASTKEPKDMSVAELKDELRGMGHKLGRAKQNELAAWLAHARIHGVPEEQRGNNKRSLPDAKRTCAKPTATVASEDEDEGDDEGLTAGYEANDDAPADDLLADEDEDGDEDLIPDLPEDCTCGGIATAIEVWLASVLHQEAVHVRILDNDDMEQRRAYGTKGQETGKRWARALSTHTSNAANWQYPHDSSAHFLEDSLEHGHADAVDDSILEKGNRRKKRLGDRCVFRGGTNEPGAKFTYERKVKVRDEKGVWTGEMKTVTVSRTAVLGPAAQAQRLDFAAAWFEGRRKPAHLKSAEHMETLKCKKEKRDLERKEVVDAVEKYKETKVERPATAI